MSFPAAGPVSGLKKGLAALRDKTFYFAASATQRSRSSKKESDSLGLDLPEKTFRLPPATVSWTLSAQILQNGSKGFSQPVFGSQHEDVFRFPSARPLFGLSAAPILQKGGCLPASGHAGLGETNAQSPQPSAYGRNDARSAFFPPLFPQALPSPPFSACLAFCHFMG